MNGHHVQYQTKNITSHPQELTRQNSWGKEVRIQTLYFNPDPQTVQKPRVDFILVFKVESVRPFAESKI